MINTELLERLDSAAYQNRPPPAELRRNDRVTYRMYYHFMRMLYALYRTGALDKDRLTEEKRRYIKETEVLHVLMESAFKTIREHQGLQEYGSTTTEGVEDIGSKRLPRKT